jgi:hypothetical protein
LNSERPASRSGEPARSWASDRPDDVAVVERGISIVAGGRSDEDVRALSERLRRLEEELDGVFETIGRLLRSDGAPSGDARRAAGELARVDGIEERLIGVLAEEGDRISRALDDHFARIERVLASGERGPDRPSE